MNLPRVAPLKHKRYNLRYMTICVGVLASGGESIICIADKAVTYSDYIQWDADAAKIIYLKTSNTVAMISGIEECVDRVLQKLGTNETIGQSIQDTASICESIYREAREELVTAKFLTPRLLTRDEYVAATISATVNPYISDLAKQISEYHFDCQILLVGFSQKGEAFLLSLEEPGIVTNMNRISFHAAGSGWDRAVSRLLWTEAKRSDPIDVALYHAFDAKAHAEMAVGVGFEWNAVILANGKIETVPKQIKTLIERVWSKYNTGPYEISEPDDLPPPPQNWKSRLRKYSAALLSNQEGQ